MNVIIQILCNKAKLKTHVSLHLDMMNFLAILCTSEAHTYESTLSKCPNSFFLLT